MKTVEDFRNELISVISHKNKRDEDAKKLMLAAAEVANAKTEMFYTQLRELVSGLDFNIKRDFIPHLTCLIIEHNITKKIALTLTPRLYHNNDRWDFHGYDIKPYSNIIPGLFVTDFELLYAVTNLLKRIILQND